MGHNSDHYLAEFETLMTEGKSRGWVRNSERIKELHSKIDQFVSDPDSDHADLETLNELDWQKKIERTASLIRKAAHREAIHEEHARTIAVSEAREAARQEDEGTGYYRLLKALSNEKQEDAGKTSGNEPIRTLNSGTKFKEKSEPADTWNGWAMTEERREGKNGVTYVTTNQPQPVPAKVKPSALRGGFRDHSI